MDITTAEELADYIVKKCILDKHPVTNMQLQSILYCIQRDCLKKTGKPAFYNEFSVWAFGPVIPSIYYKYLGFGVEPIDFDFGVICIDTETEEFVDPIIEKVRAMKPWDIVTETHKDGGAWKEVYKTDDPSGGEIIPKELIKEKG